MSEFRPDFIFAGASRCGSTWLQNALAEHPGLAVTSDNPINFFDVRYHRGIDWYEQKFPEQSSDVLVGESSPGYMKNPLVPERIASTFSDIKLLFTLRNPVERAFSEWWHERSFDRVRWDFEAALSHHPAFDVLLRPGFYNNHLRRFDEHFGRDQIKISFFEDFTDDNEAFAQEIYAFLGVDPTYTPSIVGERVNEANHLPPRLNHLKSWIHSNFSGRLYENVVRPAYQPLKRVVEADSAYKRGIPDDVRAEMEAVFVDDVRALEDRTGRDLGHWIEQTDLGE